MKPKVVVSAGAGFVGSRVVAASFAARLDTRWITRRPARRSAGAVLADLTDSVGVQRALRERDVLVHCASRTTGTADEMWRDNVVATQHLVEGARASGVRRIIYISTTGVYDRSYGEFGDPSELRRAPRSPLSSARIAAEDIVLNAGGTVIRPHLVLGAGDRWVAPALLGFMQRNNAWIGGRDVRVAAIPVTRLAEAVVKVAMAETLPSVLHAADPNQTSVAAIAAPFFAEHHLPLPETVMSVSDVAAKLRPLGVSTNAVMMLGRDSIMHSEPFWRAASDGHQRITALEPVHQVA